MFKNRESEGSLSLILYTSFVRSGIHQELQHKVDLNV